jgi:hypothetical protein
MHEQILLFEAIRKPGLLFGVQKLDAGLECTRSDGHRSGRHIDHPPGVLLFELNRAPVSERGTEPLAVVDLIDEAWQ